MDKNIFMLLLKYSLLTLVVYLILKYLPNQNMNEADLIFITVIIVLFYLLAENVVRLFYNEENFINTSTCNSICNSRIEHMENIVMSEATSKLTAQASQIQKALEGKLKEREQELKQITEKMEKKEINKSEEDEAKFAQDAQDGLDGESMEDESVMDNKVDEEENKYDDGRHMIMKTHPKPMKGVERDITRQESGMINNEIEYTDYNHLPLADGYDVGSFEYGYSFLPPEKWYPEPPFPPLCVSEKRCPVLPSYTTGTPLDVKEWNEARRVTPPDNIKTKYIKEKLNSGR